jgi:predicted RNA-binding Zn ribbon-like protein
VDATGHLKASLDAGLALGNRFGAEWSRGRLQVAGSIAEVEAVLRLTTNLSPVVDEEALAEFAAGGVRLYGVLALLAEGEIDAGARELNELLRATRAAPQLSQYGDEPWHLHFAGPDASVATSWLAEFATAAAMLLGSSEYELLRRCGAERCDNLFLDATRNHTQRFCSTACQNRTKVAAFRSRET